ncbi:MAG: potassium transporter Kup [Betaproteobacteria bacterium]|nr:potassium transporter Kup [Betaproteobacteria bacterium]
MSNSHDAVRARNLGALVVGALGVVFGDIGTSPLYALKVSVEASGAKGGSEIAQAVYGVLSLITWALIFVVTVKYVLIIMRADNHGEGGVFALTALVLQNSSKSKSTRWVIMVIGALGAALFFGDSMITPAISVLSAVEGLNVLSPDLKPYIVYIALALISGLFAVERLGTAKIGKVFGPIMLVWFSVLGLLGLAEILRNPAIISALNPFTGIDFMLAHSGVSIAILGSVVLAVTGGEALYADMGHFGLKPIQRAWLVIVFPCLLLNYFGQGALLVRDPAAIDNPFYRLAPEWALIPLLILAFMATIIASQAVISGAFSIANQAVQLGYIPRLRIKHTSADEIGQVYVSKINIFLFLGVVTLVIGFKTSENLASAYGISVTGAMAIDTLLAGYFMVFIKGWSKLVFLPVFVLLFLVDMAFLGANLFKFFEGGWLPIAVAAVSLLIMVSWVNGRERLLAARWTSAQALPEFLDTLHLSPPHRVAGTAIFMVPHEGIVPLALLHNLKHNKVLHERVVLMNVEVVNIPHVKDDERLDIKHLAHNFHAVHVRYGFMEDLHIMRAVALLRAREFHFSLMEISFFVGKEKVVAGGDFPLLLSPFIFMHRSMQGATEYFRIPFDHAIEIGGHIEV